MSGAALPMVAGLCAAAVVLVPTLAAVPVRRSYRHIIESTRAAPPAGEALGSDGTRQLRWSARIPAGCAAVARRLGAAFLHRIGIGGDDAAAALVGSMLLIAGPLALVDVRLGAIALIVIRIRPVLAKRRRRLVLERRIVGELPEVIDLVRLGLASGGSTLVALRAVAARPTGPVTEALAAVVARVGVGHRIADALEDLPAVLGEPVRPLVRALVSSERYGVELGPTLDRLADEARDDRRRRAQASARRVPIQMLLPLVLCILPAFVVLTLVPTLVSAFEALDL